MTEVPLGGARHWVEFADPAYGDAADPAVLIRADLTWLTSRWRCIFGQGCQGIYAARPNDGCCTLGAHFSDAEDLARTQARAQQLRPDQWQWTATGRTEGIKEVDPDGEAKTRVVDGACIFLNRPGFPAGAGCALHQLAFDLAVPTTQTKPDVCWQLPIRRTYEQIERPDGTTAQVMVVAEFDRRGWGQGGHDLDWYCTGSPAAHVGAEAVYLSARDELVELLGEAAYDVLRTHCQAREEAVSHLTARQLPLVGLAPHPAGVVDSDRPAPDRGAT